MDFKSWDDYTELEQAHQLYSDYYKDVNGFRPRNDVSDWTLEDFDRAMESLSKEMEVVMDEDNARKLAAIEDFEKLLKETAITCGCSIRQAWEYLKQAEGDDWYDAGMYEYNTGLPYGYLKYRGLEKHSTSCCSFYPEHLPGFKEVA